MQQCYHYKPPKQGYQMGTCEYPIPIWLRNGAVPYFINPVICSDCMLFITKDTNLKETEHVR